MSAVDTLSNRTKRPLLNIARSVLFGLPAPDRGGRLWPLMAVAVWVLAVVRATVLGYLVAFLPIAFFGADYVGTSAGRWYAATGFVVFEELARWSYGLAARRPVRAWLVFLVLIELVETVAYALTGMADALAHHRPFVTPAVYLLSRSPAILLHIVATLVFITVWKKRPAAMMAALAAVTVGHIAFDYAAPAIVTALTGLDHVGAAPH